MASKKSKTQQAKASARRQARKARAAELADQGVTPEEIAQAKEAAKPEPKKEKKPKKERFNFLKSVKAEMKRVTWPTRTEVIRWSLVVVAALVFFGVFVAVLDNLIVTPIVYGISSLGA